MPESNGAAVEALDDGPDSSLVRAAGNALGRRGFPVLITTDAGGRMSLAPVGDDRRARKLAEVLALGLVQALRAAAEQAGALSADAADHLATGLLSDVVDNARLLAAVDAYFLGMHDQAERLTRALEPTTVGSAAEQKADRRVPPEDGGLAAHPVVEALVVADLGVDQPTSVLMGDPWVVALASGSARAHAKFRASLQRWMTATDQQSRSWRAVRDLTAAYSDSNSTAPPGPRRAELLRDMRAALATLATGQAIDIEQRMAHRVVSTALASPDPELTGDVLALLDEDLGTNHGRRMMAPQAWAVAILDSLEYVKKGTNLGVITAAAARAWGSAEVGQRFAAAAAVLGDAAPTARTDLMLDLLLRLTDAELLGPGNREVELAEQIIDRVTLDPPVRELPQAYHALMEIAAHPAMTAELRNRLLNRLEVSWHYIDDDAATFLAPVIIDICRLVLGSSDAVKVPLDPGAEGAMSVATDLVRQHSEVVFTSALATIVPALHAYELAVRNERERMAMPLLLDGPDGAMRRSRAGRDANVHTRLIVQRLSAIIEQFEEITACYMAQIQRDTVRTDAAAYVDATVRNFADFWHQLDREVRTSRNLRAAVQDLHSRLSREVLPALRQPVADPEAFDPVVDGRIELVLRVCADAMAPHDIRNDVVIWSVGLPFLARAIEDMPIDLAHRILEATRSAALQSRLERHIESTRSVGDVDII